MQEMAGAMNERTLTLNAIRLSIVTKKTDTSQLLMNWSHLNNVSLKKREQQYLEILGLCIV